MKIRITAVVVSILLAGTLSAQTLTDVINEFNEGVAKVNNQEYDVSLEHFNQVLTLAEAVGDEANEMKLKAEEQIPLAYYRQATLFLKRRQFDNAIPYLEKTIEFATLYENNQESNEKANRYLMQSYMVEGQRNYKNESYDDAMACFDKALAMDESLYQAHQGKGMIFLDKGEIDMMMEEFNLAKEGALSKNDSETVEEINNSINAYYKRLIDEEYGMVDPEEKDYSYVIEVCQNALSANNENAYAYFRLAEINNAQIEYEAAIENALKALQFEKDPVLISGIYFQLGHAYQNTVEYDKACEALQKVVEDPFLALAEKKMGTIPGCSN